VQHIGRHVRLTGLLLLLRICHDLRMVVHILEVLLHVVEHHEVKTVNGLVLRRMAHLLLGVVIVL
jgi:hypothetical protein